MGLIFKYGIEVIKSINILILSETVRVITKESERPPTYKSLIERSCCRQNPSANVNVPLLASPSQLSIQSILDRR